MRDIGRIARKTTTVPRAHLSTFPLQFASEDGRFDLENGILKGVRIVTVGKMAVFKTGDGQIKRVMIKPAHVDALLALAKDQVIPVHESHDYYGKADPYLAQVGLTQNFRKDSLGLIADLEAAPDAKDKIMWTAARMPKRMMISPVYDFDENDPECIPKSFDATDLVETGAANTALFADESTNDPMPITIDDLKAICATPEGKEMLRGCLDGHDTAEDDKKEAAEMEDAAGVTADDKKPEDDQKPALMAARARSNRAIARQISQLAAHKTAIMSEVKVLIQAEGNAVLGRTKALIPSLGGNTDETKFCALLSAREAKGIDRGKAILMCKNQDPKAYNEWVMLGSPAPKTA